MTTTTLTLADFLLARLAEGEAAAERGRPHPDPTTFARDDYGYLWIQPARVLSDVEAKRRIVERLQRVEADVNAGGRLGFYADAVHDCARDLAQPYRDHPEWRAEWAL